MARRIKEGNEKERDNPASNQFPKCSPSSGIHRDSQSWVEEKGEGGDRGDLVEKKRESKGGESSQASNLAPK